MINENARESVVEPGRCIPGLRAHYSMWLKWCCCCCYSHCCCCFCCVCQYCRSDCCACSWKRRVWCVRAEFNKNSNGFPMIISWLAKSNSKRCPGNICTLAWADMIFPLYFRIFVFSISYVCAVVVIFFFLKIYLQQLSMRLSTRQELRLNSFIAWPGLSVVSLSLFLSIWYLSLSVWLSVCCRVFVWLLRLQLHASLTVNSRQAEHTFVLTLFYLWHPLSFPSLSLSLSLV